MLFLLSAWLLLGFIGANIIVGGVLFGLRYVGVSLADVNQSIVSSVAAAFLYVITLALVLGVPWLIAKKAITLRMIGLDRLPTWMDIGLAPAGFIAYILASGIVVAVIGYLIPVFDIMQVQDVGFDNLSQRYEYFLAFITLVVIAPFAEEALFRGYMYGKLRRAVPVWVAMIATSLLFGAIHAQWNVAIDVFVLSMVACSLREITGSIWAGTLLHMIKNAVAFYILFINTSFLVQ